MTSGGRASKKAGSSDWSVQRPMAPIRIQHVVSFTSQDPRHPVDNLLCEDMQPWLSCPRDRSRQLKVEVQLERASRIAYIDVGNSGSAFLQIDAGRSSWPVDKPFVSLLPTATLITPADSKLEKNGSGVRMFKEGDFLEESAGEKWDRLRITCSQPFNKQAQFGLSFLRLRSALDEEDPTCTSPTDTQSAPVSGIISMKIEKEDVGNRDQREERIKEKLQQAMSPPSPRTPCLSRTVRMLLSAAQSRKHSHPTTSPPSPSIPHRTGESEGHCGESPVSSGSCPETSVTPSKPLPADPGNSSSTARRRAVRARGRGRRQSVNPQRREDYFPRDVLPQHASSCGDVYQRTSILLSSSSDDDSWDGGLQLSQDVAESWVTCPLCAFRFRSSEIEEHASTCGE